MKKPSSLCLVIGGASYDTFLRALTHMPFLSTVVRNGAFGPVTAAMPSTALTNNVSLLNGYGPFEGHQLEYSAWKKIPGSIARVVLCENRDLSEKLRLDSSTAAHLCVHDYPNVLAKCHPSVGTLQIARDLLCEYSGRDGVAVHCVIDDSIHCASTEEFPSDAVEFYEKMDEMMREFHEIACVGITSSHGMSDKVGFDGRVKVCYVQEVLKEIGVECQVSLPVELDGRNALGSFAAITVEDKRLLKKSLERLRRSEGVYTAIGWSDAVGELQLSAALECDIVVIAEQNSVLGRTPSEHTGKPLCPGNSGRSYGGLSETVVPFLVNTPLKKAYRQKLTRGKTRNYEVWDYLSCGIGGPEDRVLYFPST